MSSAARLNIVLARAAQSADTPADVVPEEVAAELGDFFREKSASAVAAFAGDLVDALFKGVPESANSKEIPAKTKVPRAACVYTGSRPRALYSGSAE